MKAEAPGASDTGGMRIGTWNLEGRWSPAHGEFLGSLRCDVLLLTELHQETRVPGMRGRTTYGLMAPGRFWAGVFSAGGLAGFPDPHPASALGMADGLLLCGSVLPWRSCGRGYPWIGERQGDKTAAAVAPIARLRSPLIWGGDWNHALEGPDHAGSRDGRDHILGVVAHLGLQVPTAELAGCGGERSIDHIAVPKEMTVRDAAQVTAALDGRRMSDHDAYVVEVDD